jgi:hypothetical protein
MIWEKIGEVTGEVIDKGKKLLHIIPDIAVAIYCNIWV